MTKDEVRELASRIGKHLRAHKSALMQETKIHDAIAAALTDAALVFEREHVLTPRDRLDFWLPDTSVAIEVKKEAAGLAGLHQLGRYLEHPNIAAVILIAMRISPEMPATFRGKPLVKLELWRHLL